MEFLHAIHEFVNQKTLKFSLNLILFIYLLLFLSVLLIYMTIHIKEINKYCPNCG